MTRYAVYYSPAPGSPLRTFGSSWLGRDAASSALAALPAIDSIPPERRLAMIAAPRRYGFHATLKPPFVLAADRTDKQLRAAFGAFAAACEPFDVPGLRLSDIGGFLALTLWEPSEPFERLAERAVRAFEPFRAAPSVQELERRLHPGLTARERELLATWGYPYVLDAWRFHLTLTQRLADAERASVRATLEPFVAQFAAVPLRIDAVSLFMQPALDEPFVELARATLTGAALTEVRTCP
jgi:putative phosphonate metabolism protein